MKRKKSKVVYTAMCLDFLHPGHINILTRSKKLGKLIIGVLTDEAISEYKRVPIISFEKRLELANSIKDVYKVVPQKTLDYRPNLRKYKPDIVTNGDDWKTGIQKETRQQVIDTLKEWGGKLVEFPYTKGVSSTLLIEDFRKNGVTPDYRMCMLRRLINVKPIVRVLEAHSGLSALVAERASVGRREFDAIWQSSLTDSASKGKPDIELVDFTSRCQRIEEILEVTTKPLIIDGDTGGLPEHFSYMVRTLERLGVSAVIIEDKRFPKRNSLLENAKHIQEDTGKFCEKIRIGKKSQITQDFMIIARIESLIMGKPVIHALRRAACYIEAGADAIMIHSKEKNPDEIFKFCREYRKLSTRVPLIVVPTTYNTVKEEQLIDVGVNVVIYANHLLRSSYKAMAMTAYDILYYGRSKEASDHCSPVKEIFDLTNK